MTSTTQGKDTKNLPENNSSENKMGISGFSNLSNNSKTNEPQKDNGADKNSNNTENIKTKKSDVIRMTSLKKVTSSNRNKFIIPALAIVLVLLLGFLAYKNIFENVNFLNPIPSKDDSGANVDVPATDKNRVENPLNGMYFSKENTAEFKDRKPMAVMVNNYVIARPSAGLSQADVVYEAVAEGGITRLMPIFYSRIPDKVSSVRSARYYFVELASAYSAHYIHWGAAHVPPCQKSGECEPETNPDVDAYSRIVQLGLPNLDGGNYGCSGDASNCSFARDQVKLSAGVPMEHTAYVNPKVAYQLAKQVRPEESWHKYIPVENQWDFKDSAPLEERGDIGAAIPITYNYWDTMSGFNVEWRYDKENNEYVRYQGGTKQTDANNGEELRASSVIVRYTEETAVGDKKNHLYQEVVGSGDALIFQDGKVIKATWNRPRPDVLDVYTDSNGDPVELVRGQIWVQLLPIGQSVSYEASAPSPASE